MSDAHTPTPWVWLSGGIISRSPLANHSSTENLIGIWKHVPSKANTDFIRRACNAHDALLAACERVEVESPHEYDCQMRPHAECTCYRADVAAAIALAKEGQQ